MFERNAVKQDEYIFVYIYMYALLNNCDQQIGIVHAHDEY